MFCAEFSKWNFQIASSRGQRSRSEVKLKYFRKQFLLSIREQRELFVVLRGGGEVKWKASNLAKWKGKTKQAINSPSIQMWNEILHQATFYSQTIFSSFFTAGNNKTAKSFFFGWNEATATVLAFSHVEAADYQNVSLTSAIIWAGGSIWAVLLKTLQDAMSLDWHFAQSTPENIFPIARFLIIQTLTVFAISLFFP